MVSTFVVSLPFLSSPDSPGYLGCLLVKQFGKIEARFTEIDGRF
jgi:hypothetical protein